MRLVFNQVTDEILSTQSEILCQKGNLWLSNLIYLTDWLRCGCFAGLGGGPGDGTPRSRLLASYTELASTSTSRA